jgi:hypothetical protein
MKKIILSIIILSSFILSSKAQTGSILLYGNIGFNTNKNGGVVDVTNAGSIGSFSIDPGIGYQFNKNWTGGVEGGYNYFDAGLEIQRDYSAGAFLRHSMSIAGIFSWYTQLGIGYEGESINENSLNASDKATGFYVTITPAISANIKNGFALNFAIGGLDYKSLKWTDATTTSSTFGLTFGKEVSIGISKNFGGK